MSLHTLYESQNSISYIYQSNFLIETLMTKLFFSFLIILTVLLQSCTQEAPQISQASKDAALTLAQESQKAMGMHLMNEINKHGLLHAISFCNDTAEILTHSKSHTYSRELGRILKVDIKRASDKNRNPNNTTNKKELAFMDIAKTKLLNGETIEPEYQKSGDMVTAYIPIMTKAICLNCHGKPSNMKPEVVAKIKELYPQDKAINYEDGELRGIWVVRMKEIDSERINP